MTIDADLISVAPGVRAWIPDSRAAWGLANCGLITSGSAGAVVDTPYTTELTRRFLRAAERTQPGADLSLILTTHSNGDHSWGNQCLPGAEIIATERASEHICYEPDPRQLHALLQGSDPATPMGWYVRRYWGHHDFSDITPVPPTRTFSGALDVTVGDIPVELREVGPAHTVGDMVVHLPRQRVVFAGDVLFAGDHPCHWAGPLAQVIAACEQILSWNPDVVVPGHGPLLGQDGVREHIAYLTDLRAAAREFHERGASAQQAATELYRAGRYPEMGLPERLVITLATEFRHLAGDSERPLVAQLVAEAAQVAWGWAEGAAVPHASASPAPPPAA